MNKQVFPMIFGIAVTAFLGAVPILSQQPPSLRLTLRDSVRLALRQNPQVQIANLKLAESEQDRAIARSALLPQASFELATRAERINLGSSFGAN